MTQWGLDTLFNPAKRHMDEEKRRLQSTREEVGDNSGGKRIDFESGKVVIHRPTDGDAASDADESSTKSDEPATASDQPGGTDAGVTAAGTKAKTKGEPSAAAIRAAERRKRRPS